MVMVVLVGVLVMAMTFLWLPFIICLIGVAFGFIMLLSLDGAVSFIISVIYWEIGVKITMRRK